MAVRRFPESPPVRLRSGRDLRGDDGVEGIALIELSKSEGKREVPLLLGRSCVFVAKIPVFGRGARTVSLWRDWDKKSFGCHALLELGRCTFVATKVKRAGRRPGRRRQD